jgi:hypothetical protein
VRSTPNSGVRFAGARSSGLGQQHHPSVLARALSWEGPGEPEAAEQETIILRRAGIEAEGLTQGLVADEGAFRATVERQESDPDGLDAPRKGRMPGGRDDVVRSPRQTEIGSHRYNSVHSSIHARRELDRIDHRRQFVERNPGAARH